VSEASSNNDKADSMSAIDLSVGGNMTYSRLPNDTNLLVVQLVGPKGNVKQHQQVTQYLKTVIYWRKNSETVLSPNWHKYRLLYGVAPSLQSGAGIFSLPMRKVIDFMISRLGNAL